MAKPNKTGPSKTVDIFCKKCKTPLYKYRKGGKGALVKCFIERISQDYTEQEGVCPGCEQQFARRCLIRGVPALKIMGGKVHHK
ncbi:hypothetical protein PULV_b0516 [Pseudoalteromonas ulvae UL12]|uniref:Zn-ribbon motif protein n=1 Tax=Pseudoalteromonas ulvae TaxID=107327 RepID=A0A244CLP5_PSEDV|nr:hypothetical protein [Pseudoalteromonas ulvae]MBE0365838.1 hypothetical protein [Pseudoalteromonas ulvae UL12]OUL56530.1 hypothetical protein B1199_17880 [Pseudoalteromonas ulvae]